MLCNGLHTHAAMHACLTIIIRANLDDHNTCAGICKQVIEKLEVEGKRKKIPESSQDLNPGPSNSS